MRRYAGLSILCACVVAAEAQVQYREVAQEAGIDFQHYNGAQGENTTMSRPLVRGQRFLTPMGMAGRTST